MRGMNITKLRREIAIELEKKLGGKWRWLTNVPRNDPKQTSQHLWISRGFKDAVMKKAYDIHGNLLEYMYAVYVRVK